MLIRPAASIVAPIEDFNPVTGLQLIFLGPPGAGKGTQAIRISAEFGFKHLSTGDLLRKEVASDSKLGQKVKKVLNEGKLVDDHTVLELLTANCNLEEESYIFDGFPRNVEQAKDLDQVVLKGERSKAFYFYIDSKILLKRLVNRRSCTACGEIFNIVSRPPKQKGVCDKCGHDELIHRRDDHVEVVSTRLATFEKENRYIVDYYKKKRRLVEFDASSDSNAIFHQIKNHLVK